ncbi:short chain dehydrogenase [Colletotrichum truncatum]|uniref:Short chain dehydrogenase n=1 Tax=Colletotrichum truncatum TaxID=5467 RepID=A0ACC3ZFQ9_COLTU|nr:short chain dehydrogenase [Colletotrichum truncatum]KAF6801653.1 short chain dehydrogenase [Colletotrichum truncatum]
MQDLTGKVIFIAGGSTGLGKSIAKILAVRGAHITIFGRRPNVLEETRNELLRLAISPKQEINAVALDLMDAAQVEKVFKEQPRLPDALYCVAGGCVSQLGFFTDLSSQQLEQCMQNNYLTSVFPSHSILKLWIEDDKSNAVIGAKKTRQLIFISSAAALCNVPGYIAYAAPKCAQRALADTLRQEAAIYSTPTCEYKVHCAFPNTFMTDAFMDEQKTKPELTKRIESSDGPIEKLKTKILPAEYIAEYIVGGVAKGDFALVSDFDTEVLWSNMLGSSPKRGLGFVDSILGLLSGFLVWPVLRYTWTRMCAQAHKKEL